MKITKLNVAVRAALLLLSALIYLVSTRVHAADAVPLPGALWSQAWTLYGPTGSMIDLSWYDPNTVKADFYDVVAVSLERPAQNLNWRWTSADLGTASAPTPEFPNAIRLTRKKLKIPGGGHWSFVFHVCVIDVPSKQPPKVTATCGESSTLDPKYAEVNGKPQAWWVYGYTPPPSKVIPVPSSAPRGAPSVTVAKAAPPGPEK